MFEAGIFVDAPVAADALVLLVEVLADAGDFDEPVSLVLVVEAVLAEDGDEVGRKALDTSEQEFLLLGEVLFVQAVDADVGEVALVGVADLEFLFQEFFEFPGREVLLEDLFGAFTLELLLLDDFRFF